MSDGARLSRFAVRSDSFRYRAHTWGHCLNVPQAFLVWIDMECRASDFGLVEPLSPSGRWSSSSNSRDDEDGDGEL
jgi:hypothetical protein